MSAIKTLQQTAQGISNVTQGVNLNIRHLLAKALRDSGKFNNVNSKADNRRVSLNVILNGSASVLNLETVKRIAKDAGLVVDGRIASSSYREVNLRITTLQTAGNAGIGLTTVGNTPATTKNTLADALVAGAAGQVGVMLGGRSLGNVSAETAQKIRELVAADQKPKYVVLKMVNLDKHRPEDVTVPLQIGEAISNSLPSFSHSGWTVKSTNGISSVKNSNGGHWVYTK